MAAIQLRQCVLVPLDPALDGHDGGGSMCRVEVGVPDRFYAAAPLVASSGHRVGTFCIGCSTPKTLTAHQARNHVLCGL